MNGGYVKRKRSNGKKYRLRVRRLARALAFYANPDTYHAIGMLPDPPCGEFMDDFSPVPWSDYNRWMPGKRARLALRWERPAAASSAKE